MIKILYRHKVYGLESCYPSSAIIAANHASFLDPPIIAVSFPDEIHFLARKSLFDIPIFGWLIRKVNAHPVKSGSKNLATMKMIGYLLEKKKKVLIFPEGTRSKTGKLNPIQPGIGMLVMHYKCCIIPTYIHGANNVWNVNKKIPKLFGKTACVFGTPIYWDEFAHLEKKEAKKAASLRVEKALFDLKSWYENGALGVPP